MSETWKLLVLHQAAFQGMFIAKNIILKQKIGMQIRGQNKEATIATSFFALFIIGSIVLSFLENPIGKIESTHHSYYSALGLIFLIWSLIISGFSLAGLKDSWRVGIIEGQETALITSGIYMYTRNPFFVSYILLFSGYMLLLQNVILLPFVVLNAVLVHKMVLREERYLESIHGEQYSNYKKSVRRYF